MPRQILIVDDLATNRRILSAMLSGRYEVLEAESGQRALGVLGEKGGSVSAVLLDVRMPDMDGFGVLSRIRGNKCYPTLPVIMISGSDDEKLRIDALAAGANDFIMKPYKSEVILHCLKNNIALYEASAAARAAQRDRLTGLYTREAFFERVSEAVAAHEPGYYIMSCFDIDRFKVINDQYGTQKGDEALRHVAQVFTEGFTPNGGICCRVSADDFAVLYPASFKDSDEIALIRERASDVEGLVTPMIFSIGRYLVDDLSIPPIAMYDRASLAAGSVKSQYGGKIAAYSESMREKLNHEQEMIMEMARARKERQFEVWFQPQYNHSTEAMIGAEALVRWRHPVKGLIPPGEFIPLFEQNGFIYELDKYVWEEVCRRLRRWLDQGRNPLPVSVNVSRYDMFRSDLIETLTGLLRQHAIPAELLRIEITESAFSETPEDIIRVVRELIDLGFTVEIDDFGSGYSSLNTLKDVPAQILKLDMKFLENKGDTSRGGNIVESVVRMAKWLGMSVIAEGVETLAQADYLRSIGCSYMQGYYFARPMTAEDYERHCAGVTKEEKLLTLETVDNLDNNSFWDPASMDTLIFNSYVGAACIFEYHDGSMELLRATEKYAEVIGSAGMTVEAALRLDWTEHMDESCRARMAADLDRSLATKQEVTGEYVFLDLPGCPRETYLRSTMRVIATAGDRRLVYCTNENITAQRKAELTIKETSEQLQNMMDYMPGGYARLRVRSDGTISPVYINKGLSQMLGLSDAEVMRGYADSSLGMIHPDDMPAIRAALDEMLERRAPMSLRYRLHSSGGDYIWMNVTCRMTEDAQGTVYLNSYYTDATEQVKDEERQKAILDNLPCGAGVYELAGGEMRLVYQNRSYWQLVGLNEEAFPDDEPMSAIHPNDVPTIMQELSLAVQQDRDVSCDILLRHLTLGYRPVHLAARTVPGPDGRLTIYATFAPIANDDLSYQQMLPLLLSAVMNSTNDLAFAKDSSFRYLSASRAFVKMAGLNHERELIGRTDYELFAKELADKYRRDDELLLQSGRAIVDEVERIASRDGAPRYSSTSKYLLRDASGKAVGLYGVGRDITKSIGQETRLSLLAASIPGGLASYVCTVGDFDPAHIRIVYFNDGFCRLFGFTREEYQSRASQDPASMVFAQDQHILDDQWIGLMKHGTPINCLYRAHIKGGGYKWISHKAVATEREGDSLIINAVLQDVTEQRETIEQLRISEAENKLAVKLGGTVVARFMVDERKLVLSPEAAAAYSVPDAVMNVPEEPIRLGLIAAESADAYAGFFHSIIQGSKAATATFKQKYFGKWRWMEAKSSTIFSDGKPVKAVISFLDVTERLEKESVFKRWQQSLEDKDLLSYSLFRCNLNDVSVYAKEDGRLIDFRFDEAGADFRRRALAYANQRVHKLDRERYIAFADPDKLLAEYYRGRRSDTLEYRELTQDGRERWLRLTADLVELPASTEVEAYLLYEDIDREMREELRTKELAETDPLTGVLNRAAFAERVNEIIAAEPDARHALLMLDIDGFKQVNDVFGHGAGDQALVEIARSLRSLVRHNDLVARLGGDEFMLLLRNVLDDGSVAAKARQVCGAARRAFSMEVQISGSVGIAVARHDGADFEALYRKADSALYYVKGSGKDNYVFYGENMADEILVPEQDDGSGDRRAEKKRRMLIVDDNEIMHTLLQSIFKDEFIIEKARDGASALIRLRHYGSAISVVLLDLMMPGMDGFEVLEKMQQSAELRSIPVLIVSGDESRDTCLRAIRAGASDFVTKPVDPDLLRIRVRSAVSRAENERLRAQNCLLEVQNEERLRMESAFDSAGVACIELNWLTGEFVYHPAVGKYIFGRYDRRTLWQILLTEMTADVYTVQSMQQFVHQVAEDRSRTDGTLVVELKTPEKQKHRFRMSVRKLADEFQLTNRLMITLTDLDYEIKRQDG